MKLALLLMVWIVIAFAWWRWLGAGFVFWVTVAPVGLAMGAALYGWWIRRKTGEPSDGADR